MNMLDTIVPRSDQLNADDLLVRPLTITVREVQFKSSKEQPVWFFYDGDDGKPYKPCLSMRRVIIKVWGESASQYIGRRMTLFCDETVKYGKELVGGIRISHMSHIGEAITMPLTEKRGVKRAYTVEPLPTARDDRGANDGARETADDLIRRARAADGPDALKMLAAREGIIKRRDWLREVAPDLADEVDDAFRVDAPADTATPDNPNAAEGRDVSDMGENHTDDTPAWRPAVDAHLERLRDAQAIHGVHQAILDFEPNLKGLPEDVRQEVSDAEHNAQMRFTTAAGG